MSEHAISGLCCEAQTTSSYSVARVVYVIRSEAQVSPSRTEEGAGSRGEATASLTKVMPGFASRSRMFANDSGKKRRRQSHIKKRNVWDAARASFGD